LLITSNPLEQVDPACRQGVKYVQHNRGERLIIRMEEFAALAAIGSCSPTPERTRRAPIARS
jgi:hypothetical protein